MLARALFSDLADMPIAGDPVLWFMLARQLVLSDAWALRNSDGRCIAAAGVVWAQDHGEAWFITHPEARQHMRAIIRSIFGQFPPLCYSRGLPVVVRVETEAGGRIARLAGFVPSRKEGIWIWAQSQM